MFPDFERLVIQGLGSPRWALTLAAPRLNYVPYDGQVWSYLPGDNFPANGVGVLLWNASNVDMLVACPNPTDGKPLPLPAGRSIVLLPLDSSNRVALARQDGLAGNGGPLFWAAIVRP